MSEVALHLKANFSHDGTLIPANKYEGKGEPFVAIPPISDKISSINSSLPHFQVEWRGEPNANYTLVLTIENAENEPIEIFRVFSNESPGLFHHEGKPLSIAASDVGSIDFGVACRTFAHHGLPGKAPWDGNFSITVALKAGGDTEVATETAHFRVAPFLLASAIDAVEEVLVVHTPLTLKFIEKLKQLIPQMGAKLRPVEFDDGNASDVWMQDTVEIGKVCHPTPRSAEQRIAILGGLRADHEDLKTEMLDQNVKELFQKRGSLVACSPKQRQNTRWMDWYGNLEVSPPVKAKKGKVYPFGRVLVGVQNGTTMHPEIIAFLEAQGMQTPALEIDTSWLTIGHVDEVINFVPSKDRKQFRILFPSPSLATCLLQQALLHGHKKTMVFPGKADEISIGELYEQIACSEESQKIHQALQETRQKIKEGLGVGEADFVELPALFSKGLALIPNPINGLFCNGHYIVPDPCGPQIEGKDIFAENIRESLVKLGVQVHFIDIWEPYHKRAGEIHCGTNTVRRLRRTNWWNRLDQI